VPDVVGQALDTAKTMLQTVGFACRLQDLMHNRGQLRRVIAGRLAKLAPAKPE